MFVVVHHQVRDPATFWGMVSDVMDRLPEGLKLHQSLPNGDATVEFSLWETPALESLQRFVEENLSLVSSSAFYPVESKNALGLPGVVVSTT